MKKRVMSVTNKKMFPIAEKLVLRRLDARDLEELYGLFRKNEQRLATFMNTDEYRSLDDALETVTRWNDVQDRNEGFTMGIYVVDHLAGICGMRLDPVNRRGTFHYWIDEDYEGQGIMRRCVRGLCDLAFSDWGYHKLEMRVICNNERSRKLAEELGFRYDAILRDHEWIGGKFRSYCVYSMLDSEWKEQKKL